jgi:penicillin-binding protein 1C
VPGLTGGTAAAPLLFALHEVLPRSAWYRTPLGALKSVRTCVDDGYLASELCESRDTLVPRRSHFDSQSPYHQRVHLDPERGERVHAGCAPVSRMQHRNWFVLPPALAHYYRDQHSHYRELPPWRAGCEADAGDAAQSAMAFLYPDAGGQIYVPIELDEQRGRAVLEVVHRDPAVVLYWHLDDEYAARTELRHQLQIDLAAGPHRVTVVDGEGRRLTRSFTVLARGEGS